MNKGHKSSCFRNVLELHSKPFNITGRSYRLRGKLPGAEGKEPKSKPGLSDPTAGGAS